MWHIVNGGKKMRNVRKDIFLNALACPALGWMLRNEADEVERPLSLGEKFRIEQGADIGRRARGLYPDGILVDEQTWGGALKRTAELIGDPNVRTMFEATFFVDGYATKADILKREKGGWHMVEVKSAINLRDEFIDDMAYTVMVIDRHGVKITGASLMLISGDFRLGMGDDKLFVEVDHTDEVLERVEKFRPYWELVESITRGRKPDPELRFACRDCPIFEDCLGKGVENHIFDIPRLSEQKFEKLMERGITRIEDIPPSFSLTELQDMVRYSVQSGKPHVGAGLKNELVRVSWPAYYLDFETVATAIPLYPDIAPYEKIPTQYSIHKCSGPGKVIDYFEYLADPSRNCRRELAENLIKHLGEKGSIVVYGTFEKNLFNNLAGLFPDLSGELNSLKDRVVNLQAIISGNFYHPDFRGTASIKTVLPALVPDMSYDGLNIQDGNSALAAFVYLARGKYKGAEAEAVKKNLKEYCRQDTFALVRVHEQLANYCNFQG
jgi:hypothetical protein